MKHTKKLARKRASLSPKMLELLVRRMQCAPIIHVYGDAIGRIGPDGDLTIETFPLVRRP